MKWLKKMVYGFLMPPTWLAALVVMPSFALVIWVLASGIEGHWLSYLSYGASAYALVVVALRIPGVVRAFQTGFEKHPLVRRAVDSPLSERLRGDQQYRERVTLYIGMGMNLLYAAVKLVTGMVYQSEWFGALAGYYLLLAILRLMLLQYLAGHEVGTDSRAEWKRYRLCGAVLLVMNQALAVLVFLVVRRGDRFEYPGLLVYAMAAYTFYSFTMAVIHMIRKNPSPIFGAIRGINLVGALVSMLSLETALLAQFSTENEAQFNTIMTAATGAAVCLIVLALAVYMIVRATQQIRKI